MSKICLCRSTTAKEEDLLYSFVQNYSCAFRRFTFAFPETYVVSQTQSYQPVHSTHYKYWTLISRLQQHYLSVMLLMRFNQVDSYLKLTIDFSITDPCGSAP